MIYWSKVKNAFQGVATSILFMAALCESHTFDAIRSEQFEKCWKLCIDIR